jgi:hypothetical protein
MEESETIPREVAHADREAFFCLEEEAWRVRREGGMVDCGCCSDEDVWREDCGTKAVVGRRPDRRSVRVNGDFIVSIQ